MGRASRRKRDLRLAAVAQQGGNLTPSTGGNPQPRGGRIVASSESYHGLTPHPDHMRAYEELLPGSTERFLALAESEVAHRRSQDIRKMDLHVEITREEAKLAPKGQWMAFAIALIGITGSVVLGVYGHPVPSTLVGGGSLGVIILGFLRSGKKK
jgi:uncharacterized membrane protein